MLVPPKQDASLQQGDVIRDVPFVILAGAINVKAQGVQGQERLNAQDLGSFAKVKEFSQGKHLVAATVPLVLQPGMVATQGCDIDYKDHITLVRVFPIDQLLQDARDAIEHNEPLVLHEVIRRLTEGHDSPNLVYLGSLDGLGRCVADLMARPVVPGGLEGLLSAKPLDELFRRGHQVRSGPPQFVHGSLRPGSRFLAHERGSGDRQAVETRSRRFSVRPGPTGNQEKVRVGQVNGKGDQLGQTATFARPCLPEYP